MDIDDEDSLTERFGRSTERKLLDIAVIRVPRISNFTDFSPFEHYENVSLRYVDQVSDLHQPDMILLPGTKSTIADLRWLRQSGLEAATLKAADAGTLIFGVCGGYQMLGRTVSDPEQVEAAGVTEISGMILRALCARKGVSFDALATFDTRGYKERQYDLLADVVRGGLDMSFVYRVLRREV